MISLEGPLGPGLRPQPGEYRCQPRHQYRDHAPCVLDSAGAELSNGRVRSKTTATLFGLLTWHDHSRYRYGVSYGLVDAKNISVIQSNSTDKFTCQYLRAAFRRLASKICFHPVAARVVAEYLGDVEVRNMVNRVLHPKLF